MLLRSASNKGSFDGAYTLSMVFKTSCSRIDSRSAPACCFDYILWKRVIDGFNLIMDGWIVSEKLTGY